MVALYLIGSPTLVAKLHHEGDDYISAYFSSLIRLITPNY